jgi:GNAT superfamily N-acetyltransferase
MEIRRAKCGEGRMLSGIALRSKAYWGYDCDFIEACRDVLTISEENISSNLVYVIEESSKIIGFFSLTVNSENNELDSLFIEPEYIGKGFGRLLWNRIIEAAEEAGIREFTIDADPNAEGFYIKMGAVRIGEAESSVLAGRKLPLLKVTLI